MDMKEEEGWGCGQGKYGRVLYLPCGQLTWGTPGGEVECVGRGK